MSVKVRFVSTTERINLVKYIVVSPLHQDIPLGIPCVSQLTVRLRPQQWAIEACVPGDVEKVHFSVFPNALTSCEVIRVESPPQGRRGDVTLQQHKVATWNGGYMHALGHSGSTEAVVVRSAIKCVPKEQ